MAVRSSIPNSSASSSVSTTAAQLTATNGPPPPPAQLVHLARDELLAGSALAFDQDREVSGGDTLDTRPQLLHDGRGSNERRNA